MARSGPSCVICFRSSVIEEDETPQVGTISLPAHLREQDVAKPTVAGTSLASVGTPVPAVGTPLVSHAARDGASLPVSSSETPIDSTVSAVVGTPSQAASANTTHHIFLCGECMTMLRVIQEQMQWCMSINEMVEWYLETTDPPLDIAAILAARAGNS